MPLLPLLARLSLGSVPKLVRDACRQRQQARPRLAVQCLEDRTLLSLTWNPLGPAPIQDHIYLGGNPTSGRVVALAADPANANILYAAAATGGVWKTMNGGTSWTPLTDNQATLVMGALALAPSNSNIIYAGTGEATNVGDSFYGRGVLKSTDGGSTWTLLQGNTGSNELDRHTIAQIAVDPADANIVYVAVHDPGINGSWYDNREGVWKSTDGGTTWTQTSTSISRSDAFSDITIDPTNSQVLYIAVGTQNGSSANGVYKTTNGGATWAPAGNFPMGASDGNIKLAMAPTNQLELFAAITNPSDYSLLKMLKSTDGGATWTVLSNVPDYQGMQGNYDSTLAIDPADANVIYAGGTSNGAPGRGASPSFIRSTDGGATWTNISVGADGFGPHTDDHAIAFDANGRLVDGNDGGVWRLDNPTPGQIHWTDLNTNLSTIQFYGVALNPQNAAIAYGGNQDNGTVKYTGSSSWDMVLGGDGGFVRVDSSNPNTVYYEQERPQGKAGFLVRSDNADNTWTNVSSSSSGINPADISDFFVPYVMDPNNSARLVLGTDHVYETTNKGGQWTVIGSPGLHGFNPLDNYVDAIAISKSDPSSIWVTTHGFNPFNSEIFVTTDDGASWQERDVLGYSTGDPSESVVVDPTNGQVAYVVLSRFTGGAGGHVFKISNNGTSWTDISGNLPDLPTHALALDPASGALYVGNDNGVYVSVDNGSTWSRLGTGLPNVQVRQLELNSTLGVLVAATFGRGVWEVQLQQTMTATLVGNQLQIQGSSGSSNAIVRLAPGDPTTVQVLDNDSVIGSFATSAVSSIAVNLTGGNNTLVVDQRNGNPVPVGGLTYDGSIGGNTLVVNGASTTTSQSITLDTMTPAGDTPFGTITGLAAGVISYEDADTSSVTINGGTHGNTFTVRSTQAGTALTLNTGSGNDTVNLGSTANKLDPLQGSLTVNGQTGSDTLNFKDQGQSTGQNYTLSPTTVTRPGMATVSYGTIEKLSLTAGSGDDAVTLSGVLTATVALTGGTGTNTLTGPNATSTWAISAANGGKVGKVSFSAFPFLVGGSANDTFKFSGSGSVAGTIQAGGGTTNKLDYSALSTAITVNLQTLSAPRIDGGAAAAFSNIESVVGSSATTDQLIGPDMHLTWTISAANGGKAGSTSFSKFENLVGGSGVDIFKFTGVGSVSGSIDGGSAPLRQGNWLDYSSLKTAVTVNLQTGAATLVGGGVSQIQNVHGSNYGSTLTGNSQGNILIGGTGSDTITGGTGASLLIGDKGAAQVNGGSGGDILVGDYTTYDAMTTANQNALMAILAEWRSADSYATRFHDIDTGTGGGLNGASKLNFGSTVKNDGFADTLTAAVSAEPLDWFFQGAGDVLVNQEAGEHINNT